MKDIITGMSLLWLLPWSFWVTKYLFILLKKLEIKD